MRIIYLTIVLTIIINSLSAQDQPPVEDQLAPEYLNDEDPIDEENKEAMESMMIWKLTEELDLKVEQADKFFPRFHEHRKAIDILKNKERSLGKSLNQDMKNKNMLTSSQVKKIIKESTSLRKKMADLEEKFLLESGEILDPNQQAKLGLFKHKMMKNMKGKMKKRRGMKGGKKYRRGKKHNKRGYWN
jgi:hypothetical protein